MVHVSCLRVADERVADVAAEGWVGWFFGGAGRGERAEIYRDASVIAGKL